MFSEHVIEPQELAQRLVNLIPEYLPGMDTGAFEATDRKRCWNKTLEASLIVIGRQESGLQLAEAPIINSLDRELRLIWKHDRVPVFAALSGWGGPEEVEQALHRLLSFKCPQKLFLYSCSKWRDAVLQQIEAGLLRYPYHLRGEQYLFLNLLGSQARFDLDEINIHQDGPLPASAHQALLRKVTGSPFAWRNKSNGKKP